MCMRHNPYKKLAAKNCFAEVIGISIISGRHCEKRILKQLYEIMQVRGEVSMRDCLYMYET